MRKLISHLKLFTVFVSFMMILAQCSGDSNAKKENEGFNGDKGVSPECSPQVPCEPGFNCIAGDCVESDPIGEPECSDERPCSENKSCVNGVCEEGAPQPPPGPVLGSACQRNADCEEDEYCHSRRGCQTKCTAENKDQVCAEGEACREGRCGQYAIDIPGLREYIAQQNEPMERAKDIMGDLKDGGVINSGATLSLCRSEHDCKAVDICVKKPGNERGVCEKDPVIGDVCDGNVGDRGFDPARMRSCPETYHCNYDRQTRLGHCEKPVTCPGDRMLNDDGYCVLRCRPHTQWDGEACRAMSQAGCQVNEAFNGQECRPCPAGQVFQDGVCHAVCDNGTQWNGESCEAPQVPRQLVQGKVTWETGDLPASGAPGKATITFCPKKGGEKNYATIYSDPSCISFPLYSDGTEHGEMISERVFSLDRNTSINNMYYIKIETDASNQWYLQGIQISLAYNQGASELYYSNPCLGRWINKDRPVFLSKNDTAVCVVARTDGRNDGSWTDDAVYLEMPRSNPDTDRHIYGRTFWAGNPDVTDAHGPNNIVYRLDLADDVREFRWDDNKSYPVTFFDTQTIQDQFRLFKSGTNAWGMHGIAVYKFRPGWLYGDGRSVQGAPRVNDYVCKVYELYDIPHDLRGVAGAVKDEERWPPIYWLDNDSDGHPFFPLNGYQSLQNPAWRCPDFGTLKTDELDDEITPWGQDYEFM